MVAASVQLDPALVREAAVRAAIRHQVTEEERARCDAIYRAIWSEMDAHPKQLSFVEDRSPQVAGLCTRQAGKTQGCRNVMLGTALSKQGAYSAYFNTSKDECRNILWENADTVGLMTTIEKYRIPCKTNDTRMTIWIPCTGSRIKLIGIDDEREVKKVRGPTYDDGIIDECQDIPYAQQLAVNGLGPGTVKRKGSVRIVGTPTGYCTGFFFDVTREGGGIPGWNVYRWSIEDNPGIPHAAEYVERIRISNGWALDDPTFLSEYKGRWVEAASDLVYRLASLPEEKRYYDRLPSDLSYDWRYLVGVDLGYFPDPFAIVVWAYCDDIPCLFEIESDFHEGTDTESQAGIIGRLVERYNPDRIVCDAGSGGLKQIVKADWAGRYGLPVDVAEKAHKDSAIEAFNADILAGRVKFQRGSKLAEQMLVLPWQNKAGSRRVEHRRFRNDMCDAALYAYRESHFYEGAPRPNEPLPGSPDAANAEMSSYKETLLQELETESNEPMGLYDLDAGTDWTDWNR